MLLTLAALPVLAAEPTLYGRYEYVALGELNRTFKAKLDTGALTTSLSARNIRRFSRDGEEWVRFRLDVREADDTFYEFPVSRISRIKSRSEEDEEDEEASDEAARRPVIALKACLDGVSRVIEVNLADRSRFNYPLLIGSRALVAFDAAVDPARRFTARKPRCD
nr:ATP-dependent zinc protease [Gammaproteobacteria bacterium]